MSSLFHFIEILSINLLYLSIIAIASLGLGLCGLRLIRFSGRDLPSLLIYAETLGLGLLSILTAFVGLIHILTPKVAWILISLGWLLFILEVFMRFKKDRTLFHITLAKHTWFTGLMAVLLIANLLFTLLNNSLVPPTEYDELAYHLAIPKLFIKNQAVIVIPSMMPSHYPLGAEMLYTISLLISTELVAKLITWWCYLLTCVSLIYVGNKWFGNHAGWVAAVLYSATPMSLKLAGTTLVEVPLSLFSLLATVCLIEWLLKRESRSWVLAALFCGFAASIKLTGAITGLLLGGLFLFVELISREKRVVDTVKIVAAFGFLAILIVFPWYLRTYIHTGNPFFPYLYEIFGGANWDHETNSYRMAYIQLYNLKPTIKNFLSGPIYISINRGARFGSYDLGLIYLSLLPLSLLGGLFFKNPDHRKILLWITILLGSYYTSWFFLTNQIRFLMPFLAILSLLTAAGIFWLWSKTNRRFQIISQIVLIIYLISSSILIRPSNIPHLYSKIRFLTNQIDRGSYISQFIKGYQVFEYVNHNLPPSSYLYMAGYENRGYLLDRDYMVANPIGQRLIRLESYEHPGEFIYDLRKRGFTHILLNRDRLYSIPHPKNEQFAELTLATISEFGNLVYQSGPIELYKIRK